MIDVASYLGADPSFARTEMLDVLKFEIRCVFQYSKKNLSNDL